MKACCLETYNEGYNRGMEYKEQEIIKLLESIYDYPQNWDYNDPISSVIALIKGENNEAA